MASLWESATPYTYLLGWSNLDKWYYGVRVANQVAPRKDLWNIYKGSSEQVNKYVEMFGDPDVIEVRKVFESRNAAIEWENKVLRKLKVSQNKRWLNIAEGKLVYHLTKTPQAIHKWRMSNAGRARSEEFKQKLRKPKPEGHNIGKNQWGKNNPFAKPIRVIYSDREAVFNSMADFQRTVDKSVNVYAVLNNCSQNNGKFIPRKKPYTNLDIKEVVRL